MSSGRAGGLHRIQPPDRGQLPWTQQTHTLQTPDVDLVYDVVGPLPTADGRRPLLMAGHPMTAEGFFTLAEHFPDRTVVFYDPRGVGRSERKDGRTDRTPEMHTADLHALITELGGPVDIFASSGGAVNSLALVAEHPEDVGILVAHEPPLLALLPDAEAAFAAERGVQEAYHQRGSGAGMAQFIALTSWQGEFTDAYAAAAPGRPGDVRHVDRGRRLPGRPAAVGDRERDHGLPPRRRGPHRGADAGGHRGRRGVGRHPHRPHLAGHRRGPGPEAHRVPQPPRRASSAASSGMRVSRRPSPSDCARCSTTDRRSPRAGPYFHWSGRNCWRNR